MLVVDTLPSIWFHLLQTHDPVHRAITGRMDERRRGAPEASAGHVVFAQGDWKRTEPPRKCTWKMRPHRFLLPGTSLKGMAGGRGGEGPPRPGANRERQVRSLPGAPSGDGTLTRHTSWPGPCPHRVRVKVKSRPPRGTQTWRLRPTKARQNF